MLCKVLAHNIVVLIHSFFELGIEAQFGLSPVGHSELADRRLSLV